jgi:hypothetical protein
MTLGCASGEAHRQTLTDYNAYEQKHEWHTIKHDAADEGVPLVLMATRGGVKLEFSRATLTTPSDPVAPHLRFLTTAPTGDIRPTLVHELYLQQLREVQGRYIWYGSYTVRSWRLHLVFMVLDGGSYTLKYALDPL